jgi:hypothetical protein
MSSSVLQELIENNINQNRSTIDKRPNESIEQFQERAQREFATRIATAVSDAVSKYLRENVAVNAGQVVVTRGTAATQAGTTTSPGTLTAL